MINSDWAVCLADYGQTFMQSAEASSISSPGGLTGSRYSTESNDVDVAGAHRWMAPELISPEFTDQQPTNASDVYSFGCVCIEVSSIFLNLWSFHHAYYGCKVVHVSESVQRYPLRCCVPCQDVGPNEQTQTTAADDVWGCHCRHV